QVVAEDFKVDLPGPRQLLVVNLPGQFGQRPSGVLDGLGPRGGREVVEAVVEAVVAGARGGVGVPAELLVEVLAEDGGQPGVLGVVGGAGGERQECGQGEADERELHGGPPGSGTVVLTVTTRGPIGTPF